jgi:MFS family permease
MAHFGDLVGRKKMFTLSILLMAVPTLAIGLLPTYASMGIAAAAAVADAHSAGGGDRRKCPAPGCLSPSMCRKNALVSPAAR